MYAQNLYHTRYLLCLKSICLKTYGEEKQFLKKVGMVLKQKENSQPFLFFFTAYFSICNCFPCRRTPDQTVAITIEVLFRTTTSSDLHEWAIEWFVIIRLSSHLPFWKVAIRLSLKCYYDAKVSKQHHGKLRRKCLCEVHFKRIPVSLDIISPLHPKNDVEL